MGLAPENKSMVLWWIFLRFVLRGTLRAVEELLFLNDIRLLELFLLPVLFLLRIISLITGFSSAIGVGVSLSAANTSSWKVFSTRTCFFLFNFCFLIIGSVQQHEPFVQIAKVIHHNINLNLWEFFFRTEKWPVSVPKLFQYFCWSVL